ncbi:TPA: deoxycytidine deaminase [Clostridium perfringens]|nr:deoxycytidine deaminase [Clostridium perfringens]HAT4252141.1 deoxycytidine deaminase [Clostridium perfringens]HAT4270162.1 deoxycytidine deaminase [Clostridium perfringens]
MLSRFDIENELGNGINIVPFNSSNIKENSINLSASKFAWTLSSGEIFISNENKIYTHKNETDNCKDFKFQKGDSAVVNINDENFIILLPFSTTLIETQEVLAVDNRIGGSYHSKVGLVSKGIGHIGTMLGPNFSGHSLIALHNVSENPIKLKVGDTFVSITFNYLNTPIDYPNPTINGHIDKLNNFNIKTSSYDRNFLMEDWKSNINFVKEHMEEDKNFISYKKLLRKRKFRYIESFLNLRNIIIVLIYILIFILLYIIAYKADNSLSQPVWVDRFWSVGFSGIFITILSFSKRFFKNYK